MKEIISGYINIFKTDGLFLCGPLYENEKQAKETGSLVKGYINTIPITFEIQKEEQANE